VSSQEAWQYWQQLLEAVDKPAAKKLIKNLDMSNPLGIKHSLGQRRGAKYSKAPLYPFFLDTKKKHPTKVLLVRVSLGSCYLQASQTYQKHLWHLLVQ